ncbi:hypothetical protein HYY75_02675 [bacterium]|nr:hypothetical protein [bacterium]
MRFLPSWVLELLQPNPIDSIFFPISPPNFCGLLVFKRLGIKLFVNDPLEDGAIFLRSFLENQGELISAENQRKFLRPISKFVDSKNNPFAAWENSFFNQAKLNSLFYWREIARETANIRQRELLFAAVFQILCYWRGFSLAKMEPPLSSEQAMELIIGKQAEQIFKGKEAVFSLQMPFDELGDSVESSVYIIPLRIIERKTEEHSPETYFHAWIRENSDLEAMRSEITGFHKGLFFDWGNSFPLENLERKSGKAKHVVVCWSGDELPPRVHEEQIAVPLKRQFSNRYPLATLYMKTSCRANDSYDFSLVMHEN